MSVGTWAAEAVLAALLLLAVRPLRRLWRGDWRPWESRGQTMPMRKEWVKTWPVSFSAALLMLLTLPTAQWSTVLAVVLASLALLAILLGVLIYTLNRPKKLIPPALR